MSRGGPRPGSGRPKRPKNKRTIAKEQAILSSGLDPLDYMLAVMNDQTAEKPLRLEAAKSLAPFKHPRLSASEISLLDQAPREEAEVRADLLKQAQTDPGIAQSLIEIVAEMARANPVVMAQLRSILDGPQAVKTGTEA
jgi:hypothetical protein